MTLLEESKVLWKYSQIQAVKARNATVCKFASVRVRVKF